MPRRSTSKRKTLRAQPLRKVLLLVDTSRSYGRGLVRGVARYNQEHGRWSINFKPHALDAAPPPWLDDSRADGILARVGDRRMAEAIRACEVPVVDLRGVLPGVPFPFVGADDAAVARLAAEHLLDRGFRHFGFCGLPRGIHPHMDQLCDAFVAAIGEAGYPCSEFVARQGPRRGEAWERLQNRPAQWTDQQQRIARWIQRLEKPAAVMACHDDRALQVLDACRRVGAMVPEEVAVISVDNDPYLCDLAIPPLTSIDDNPQQIGYEAAALLDRMMNGEPMPDRPILIAPRGVVTRRSTDVLAIENRHVAHALRIVHEHACDGIFARDVVADMPLSRVLLAEQFKKAVGRTIGQEIQRVRIQRAKDLLEQTDLPIKQVARRSGFRGVEYLTRMFGRLTGQTPGEYRKRVRK
jgi:LacI family transcriptional regulator